MYMRASGTASLLQIAPKKPFANFVTITEQKFLTTKEKKGNVAKAKLKTILGESHFLSRVTLPLPVADGASTDGRGFSKGPIFWADFVSL